MNPHGTGTPTARDLHRRRRLRRRSRRAYIRSVYFLPSLFTLGNLICGFGAIYVAGLDAGSVGKDPLTSWFFDVRFLAAAYLIFGAMLFDALDGRVARMTRHTTDFGGQLDSLADVVSFGAAPAFLALQVVKFDTVGFQLPLMLSRLVWAMGALYLACTAIRLARFNVSNAHGEEHHMSFLGLPSPGAAAAVAGLVLIQQDLYHLLSNEASGTTTARTLGAALYSLSFFIPAALAVFGVLMVSGYRYPHLINRFGRGRVSPAKLLVTFAVILSLVVAHRYSVGIAAVVFGLLGPLSYSWARFRHRPMDKAPVHRSRDTA
ncbi:MAG: CDP-alcohol phosphatidyltransferase family protein [Phycisphaerae bacterium]